MSRNLTKALWSAALPFIFLSTHAAADYKFSVKIINNTGADVTNVYAGWNAKGAANNDKSCWGAPFSDNTSNRSIRKGKTYKQTCSKSANKQKWQRRIFVGFDCPKNGNVDGGDTTVYFPRGSSTWFKRDYATKRNDTYTVTIKASDC